MDVSDPFLEAGIDIPQELPYADQHRRIRKPSMIQRIRSRNPSPINEQDNVSTAGSVTSNMAAEIVRNSAKPILRSLTVKKRNPQNIENQITDEDAEQPSFSGTYYLLKMCLSQPFRE